VAKVRDEMGLTNLKLMIPFCRTVEEGRRAQAEMATHGLRRGENGLEIYVVCEIPSNVVLAEEFWRRRRPSRASAACSDASANGRSSRSAPST